MKIISDYGIRTNKNNYSTKVSFSGLTSKSIVKTVYPEVVSNAMNNACAKIIAELNIGSKKVMNETDKFIKLREDFSPALDSALRNEERTAWDFYINSNPKNMKAYETAQEEFSQLFSNKETYEKFLSIDSSKIIQTESNPELRQKAYDALIKGGDLIADDMIEFAKMRNEFAKTKGYDNFFDYQLKEEFDVETPFLNRLIDQVYSGAKDKIKAIQEKTYAELRQIFKTENLQGCHYGLLTDSNPAKAVNKILENYSIEDISKKAYAGMGYDVDKMIAEGNLTLDLYPRKGKNTHGFCFGIDPGKDSRILANLRNDALSLDTLNHEMGHCVYDLGISRGLPVIDRAPASSAFTEAIAMMMGDLPKRENILKNIIPEKFLVPFKKSISEDEANFVSKSLLIIDFERELYKNPNQNPAKLWADLRLKYRNQNHAPNNEWATIPHYLSHPGYYQNYFRASLMKTQIYNHLQGVLGNITENTQTAKYLKDNIFSKGASVEEYDLIKQLTGKEFSANDYIQTL